MTLPAMTFSVRNTYVFGTVEGPSSDAQSISVPAGVQLTVASPPASPGATGWNCYVGPWPGFELLQTPGPLAIGTAFTEAAAGLYGTGPLAPSPCAFELLSYRDATLVAPSTYSLGGYLRRNQYGTPNIEHASGAGFGRLDTTLMKFPYTPDQIGNTFNFKATAFNFARGGEENIANVVAYPHEIKGPPPLPPVTGLVAVVTGSFTTLTWNDLAANPQLAAAVSGYDIAWVASTLLGPVTVLALQHLSTSLTFPTPAGTNIYLVRGVTAI